MEMVSYQTPRLSLRKITPEVMSHVFLEMRDQEQMEFLGLQDAQSLETEQKKFAAGLTTYNRKFEYFQMITLESRRIVGWCGFHTWYIDHRRAELGYELYDEDLRRQGYMTEALDFVLSHGFKTMNLNRIEAFTGRSNEASKATLKKMGFFREGVMRKHYNDNGVIGDSIIFSLLKSEYRIRRR